MAVDVTRSLIGFTHMFGSGRWLTSLATSLESRPLASGTQSKAAYLSNPLLHTAWTTLPGSIDDPRS